MATCAVSGTLLDAQGGAVLSATVCARVLNPTVSGTSIITPALVETTTDSSGNFTLTLQQSLSVIFTVDYPMVGTEPLRQFSYTGTIPASTTASFTNVITIE
jgi:hypothetical protein